MTCCASSPTTQRCSEARVDMTICTAKICWHGESYLLQGVAQEDFVDEQLKFMPGFHHLTGKVKIETRSRTYDVSLSAWRLYEDDFTKRWIQVRKGDIVRVHCHLNRPMPDVGEGEVRKVDLICNEFCHGDDFKNLTAHRRT